MNKKRKFGIPETYRSKRTFYCPFLRPYVASYVVAATLSKLYKYLTPMNKLLDPCKQILE